MHIMLTSNDRIVHQTDCATQNDGVPVVWALVEEGRNAFSVLYRELDDAEPWFLHWRGTYAKCRERYVAAVTEALLGDLIAGVPEELTEGMDPRHASVVTTVE